MDYNTQNKEVFLCSVGEIEAVVTVVIRLVMVWMTSSLLHHYVKLHWRYKQHTPLCCRPLTLDVKYDVENCLVWMFFAHSELICFQLAETAEVSMASVTTHDVVLTWAVSKLHAGTTETMQTLTQSAD